MGACGRVLSTCYPGPHILCRVLRAGCSNKCFQEVADAVTTWKKSQQEKQRGTQQIRGTRDCQLGSEIGRDRDNLFHVAGEASSMTKDETLGRNRAQSSINEVKGAEERETGLMVFLMCSTAVKAP